MFLHFYNEDNTQADFGKIDLSDHSRLLELDITGIHQGIIKKGPCHKLSKNEKINADFFGFLSDENKKMFRDLKFETDCLEITNRDGTYQGPIDGTSFKPIWFHELISAVKYSYYNFAPPNENNSFNTSGMFGF